MTDQTLLDLADDYAQLRHIVVSAQKRLAALRPHLAKGTVHPKTREALERQITHLLETYSEVEACLAATPTIEGKDRAADLLRSLQGLTGAFLAATNWQSPSFMHSVRSQAGKYTGRIDATINDYQRFSHFDAKNYEHSFRREYIDAPLQMPPGVLATGSGMSAFSVAVTSLHNDGRVPGNVLVGRGSYFENKHVLQGFFPGQTHEVDEMNVNAVLSAIDRLKPSLIVLDSLCNTEHIQLPDLARLLPALALRLTRRTMLIIDNTGLAASFQPLHHVPRGPNKLQLIVVESLLKFHQFGFDKVMGGILWRNGLSPLTLFSARERLGAILPDASVLSLPEPSRELLAKRLARMDRNALYLAEQLDAHIRNKKLSAFSHVVYPGLPSYPGYAWTKHLPFRGSYFAVIFKPMFAHASAYKRFVAGVLHEAKAAGFPLTSGTSFGFSNTRIYLTALHAKKNAKPFVRISVGTETQAELATLAAIFTRAVDRFPL